MLTRLGYEVEIAEQGEAALARLEHDEFDLVLMDCNMPLMDGYETSRRIRADPRWQGLPIIALTANVLHEDRQRCEQAGMNDYLAKPFKREDLQALMLTSSPPSCFARRYAKRTGIPTALGCLHSVVASVGSCC
jgi:CheY-like chemotaxis protein